MLYSRSLALNEVYICTCSRRAGLLCFAEERAAGSRNRKDPGSPDRGQTSPAINPRKEESLHCMNISSLTPYTVYLTIIAFDRYLIVQNETRTIACSLQFFSVTSSRICLYVMLYICVSPFFSIRSIVKDHQRVALTSPPTHYHQSATKGRSEMLLLGC